MKAQNVDWKFLGLILLLCFASVLSYIFWDVIIQGITIIFNFPQLNLCAGGLAAIITICHKIKTRKLNFSNAMSFNDFKLPVEDILSFISSPVTIVCSLALAKGSFLQTNGTVEYFPLFNSLEKSFIWLVTAYLVFISVMELWSNFTETITKLPTKTETPSPISEREFEDSSNSQ